MKKFLYLLPAILLMGSCGSQNNKSLSETSNNASIEGKWLLEHVVVNDTLKVRPADVNAEAKLYAQFNNDSTFNFQTGCNAIGGRYVQSGDSIALTDMLRTEMACEDMRVEDLLNTVLLQVKTIDWTNDSTLRLNTPTTGYVVLKKCEDAK